MKLTYWVAKCLTDSACYSIRSKTKRECLAAREGREEDFGVPVKNTIEYADAFDLMDTCLSEARGWE